MSSQSTQFEKQFEVAIKNASAAPAFNLQKIISKEQPIVERVRAASTLAKADIMFQPKLSQPPTAQYRTMANSPNISKLTRPTFSFHEKFLVGRRRVSKMQSPCKYGNVIHHYLYDSSSPRHEAFAESHHKEVF